MRGEISMGLFVHFIAFHLNANIYTYRRWYDRKFLQLQQKNQDEVFMLTPFRSNIKIKIKSSTVTERRQNVYHKTYPHLYKTQKPQLGIFRKNISPYYSVTRRKKNSLTYTESFIRWNWFYRFVDSFFLYDPILYFYVF